MKFISLVLFVCMCGSAIALPPRQLNDNEHNPPKPNPARNLYHALFIQGALKEGVVYNELGPNTKKLWDNFLDYLTVETQKSSMMDVLMAIQSLQSISLKNPSKRPLKISDKHNAMALELMRGFIRRVDDMGVVRQVGLEREFRQFQNNVLKAKHVQELVEQARKTDSMSIMGMIKKIKEW